VALTSWYAKIKLFDVLVVVTKSGIALSATASTYGGHTNVSKTGSGRQPHGNYSRRCV